MKVLVTAASLHGTVHPIAEKICCTLKQNGVEASFMLPEEVRSLSGFDAVVIGSPIHRGRWLKPAVDLVHRRAGQLRQRKVWLFSDGSIDEPIGGHRQPKELARLKAKAGAVEHRLFPGGTMGREVLEFAESAVVAPMLNPVQGTYDINQVHKWAAGIARTLRAESQRLDEWHLSV